MSEHSYRDAEQLKEARKLRELFRGRFSDDEALELLRQHESLDDAVQFIFNGDPQEVRRFIQNRNAALVTALRHDSEYVQTALNQGVEASIRLFSCKSCDNWWWRKVPSRKEVSKCKLCRKRYDPVPRDQEWGLAKFLCSCGNEFWGSGWLNHTQSPCYNCQALVVPIQIVPPTRPRTQKRRAPHSCTGANCYNRTDAHDLPPPVHQGGGGGGRGNLGGGGGRGRGGRGRGNQGSSVLGYARGTNDHADDDFNLCVNHAQVCSHARSTRQRKVLYPSKEHVSTGSTVNTFMSQGELAEVYDDLQSLPALNEDDEEDE